MRAILLILALISGFPCGARSADRWLTLTEGSGLSVSSSADGSLLSMDLGGRIWILEGGSGEARALTAGSQPAARPAVSPNGRHVAFELAIGGHSQLVVMPTGGGLPRQVSFGDYDHRAPAWHPDGDRLLMSSDRGGSYDIWEVELSDLRLRQLTFAPGDERDPAWDASGSRLVYVGTTADGRDGLFIREADGRQHLLLADSGRLHGPAWRQDDGLIAYVRRSGGQGQLRLLLLSEPAVSKRVTRSENVFPGRPVWQGRRQLLYAADGRIRRRHLDHFAAEDLPFHARVRVPAAPPRVPARAAPSSWPQPVRAITGMDAAAEHWYVGALGAIWALDIHGEVRRQLGHADAVDREPALSPNRRRLAWISDAAGPPQVWIQDLDDSRARALSPDGLLASAPAWQPDSRAIAYLAADRAGARRRDVLWQAVDGGPPRRLARGLSDLATLNWVAPDTLRLGRGRGLPDRLLNVRDAAMTDAADGLRRACGPADGRWLAGLDAADRLRLSIDAGEAQALPLNEPVEDFGCTVDGELWYRVDDSLWRLRPGDSAGPRRQPLGLRWRAATFEERLVLRVQRLFDGLGPGYVEGRDIVIENGHIAAIQPWQDPPPSGRFIDARELTALPGLIDLGAVPLPLMLASEGRAWLDAGVTTIRFDDPGVAAIEERAESWLSGALPGPRIFMAGSACRPPVTLPGVPLAGLRLCQEASQPLSAQISQAHRSGQPVIASHAFPSLFLPIDELWLDGGPSRGAARFGIYGDIIELSGARGLRVASRLTGLVAMSAARWPAAELIDRYKARFPLAVQASWQRPGPGDPVALRARAQALFRAAGRGARVLAAADGRSWAPGLGLHAELQGLQAAGLQPFEILRMATRDAAAALGKAGELGELRPGAVADLLLVAGDPLRQVDAVARPLLLVLAGRVFRLDAQAAGALEKFTMAAPPGP